MGLSTFTNEGREGSASAAGGARGSDGPDPAGTAWGPASFWDVDSCLCFSAGGPSGAAPWGVVCTRGTGPDLLGAGWYGDLQDPLSLLPLESQTPPRQALLGAAAGRVVTAHPATSAPPAPVQIRPSEGGGAPRLDRGPHRPVHRPRLPEGPQGRDYPVHVSAGAMRVPLNPGLSRAVTPPATCRRKLLPRGVPGSFWLRFLRSRRSVRPRARRFPLQPLRGPCSRAGEGGTARGETEAQRVRQEGAVEGMRVAEMRVVAPEVPLN